MLKTYLTLAFRNLSKRKANSLINILGLGLGIAATLVIVLFARHELTYDQHHRRADDIYMVYKERITPAGTQPTYDTWMPLLPRLQAQMPEVKDGTRIYETSLTVEARQERFEEEAYYVDKSYFSVFDFPLLRGMSENPFPNPNSVILSEALAHKFFGEDNPIGQEITINFERSYFVSGVMKKYPRNGVVGNEILLPIESLSDFEELWEEWDNSFLFSFIYLPEPGAATTLTHKFPDLIRSIWDEEMAQRTHFRLLPLGEAYSTFEGDTRDSYALLLIALGILMIASINFMNLTTARSMERAKEIGMRKVLGASKKQLAFQFIGEAVVVIMIATAIGVLIAQLVLPYINGLFEMELAIPYRSMPEVWLLLALFGLTMGLISGSYPAFFLSNFRILESLNNVFTNRFAGVKLRNVFVVLQFAISVLLMIGAVTIAQQIQYVKDADLAFDKENLLVVPISVRDFADRDEAVSRLGTFRNELAQHHAVQDLTSSRHVPGRWTNGNTFVQPQGWEGNPLRMRFTYLDAQFFDTYGIQLLDGPGFLPDSEGDQRESVVLNEAAMKAFGWTDITDKAIEIGNRSIRVVGLIRNFNYESLRAEVEPILHFHRTPANATHRYLTLRTAGESLPSTLAVVERHWQILDPGRPLDYFLIEENMAQLYANEDRLLSMIKVFSGLSIFISCLGLYGLLMFILDKRRKEIGIRKVLGASISRIVILISSEFTKLVLLSFLLAAPVAYLLMQRWLADFAYHIPLGFDIFLLTLILALGLAWLTIVFKTARAASENPIAAIKEE